jgi:UDPglucose 6-dehydrogenase
MMKITIAGLGYVGLSNANLLAQHIEVVGIDLDLDPAKLASRLTDRMADVAGKVCSRGLFGHG